PREGHCAATTTAAAKSSPTAESAAGSSKATPQLAGVVDALFELVPTHRVQRIRCASGNGDGFGCTVGSNSRNRHAGGHDIADRIPVSLLSAQALLHGKTLKSALEVAGGRGRGSG